MLSQCQTPLPTGANPVVQGELPSLYLPPLPWGNPDTKLLSRGQ